MLYQSVLKGGELPVWLILLVLGLVFPPIVSCCLSLYFFLRYKQTNYLIPFAFYFVLFLTYNFFSIDNLGRFRRATRFISEDWYLGDPLTNLMRVGMQWADLQCSFFFFLYILAVYVLFLKTLEHCTMQAKDWPFFVIFVTTLSFRNSMDLLYYCLSVVFGVWFITRKDTLTLFNFCLLIPLTYLLHPGFLIILLPALGLYWAIKQDLNGNMRIYYWALLGIFVFYWILSRVGSIPLMGVPVIDSVTMMFKSYTSVGYWGIRTSSISGISYTIMYYIVPLIYFFIFLVSLRYRAIIRQPLVLAIFQTALLMYPNFINYVTLTERTLLVLSITSVLTLLMLVDTKKINLTIQHIVLYCVLIFLFTSFKGTGAVQLRNVFRAGSYQEIRNRSYFLPSFMLLDYKNYGYSDSFLKENRHITY